MANLFSFSDRELEVANQLSAGKSNKEIALILGISVRTVEFHMTHILGKLGVSSRAEAIVKLSETRLRESVGGSGGENPRESTVENSMTSVHNVDNSPLNRRLWMKSQPSTIVIGLLALLILLSLLIFAWNSAPLQRPLQQFGDKEFTKTETITVIILTTLQPTETPMPTLSPREINVAEARRLAAEYDQVVKEEMQKGNFEISQFPRTGKERILFSGESQEKILKLYDNMSQELFKINKEYLALYIADVQPTPYPKINSKEENEDYYQTLVREYQDYLDQLVKDGPTVQVFDPSDGIYYNRLIGDAHAKSEVMMSAMEAFHQAPDFAKVDQGADIELIRDILGLPHLQLTFIQVGSQANVPWIRTSIYEDEAQNKYHVSIDANTLVSIEPGSSPNIPAVDVKPIEVVKEIAEEFIEESSPNFVKYQNQLVFEQGSKGDIYFFTWRLMNKDWSGTDWRMMPPFLQIGMSADGKIVTIINSLDLFEE